MRRKRGRKDEVIRHCVMELGRKVNTKDLMDLNSLYQLIEDTQKAVWAGNKELAEKLGWEMCNQFEVSYQVDERIRMGYPNLKIIRKKVTERK